MAKLFDELEALKKAYDEKLEKEGENAVKEVFKEFFDKHPSAESISWTQYTPYFNDGDPCYFSVNEMELNADEDYEDEEKNSEESQEDPTLTDDFWELQNIPEEVLKSVFGDHVSVTATRDGFNVRKCNHD